MYQVNYGGRPRHTEDRIFESICEALDSTSINHSDCLLVDPKLLQAFFCCYCNEPIDRAYFEHVRQVLLEDVGYENDDSFARFLSFKTSNSYEGLVALWLWQCQFLVITERRYSLAMQVEVIYNWIRFVLTNTFSLTHGILTTSFFSPTDSHIPVVGDLFMRITSLLGLQRNSYQELIQQTVQLV
jgi:hypothetical protein